MITSWMAALGFALVVLGSGINREAKEPMVSPNRAEAEHLLFEQVNSYMSHPVEYGRCSGDMGRIYFNNEYPLDLPVRVILTLWPEALVLAQRADQP